MISDSGCSFAVEGELLSSSDYEGPISTQSTECSWFRPPKSLEDHARRLICSGHALIS